MKRKEKADKMKQNMFKGLGNVFKFTFIQNIKEKIFILSTVIIAAILFGSILGINVYLCYSSKDKDETDKIEQIYFVNNTELTVDTGNYDKIELIDDEDKKPGKNDMVIVFTEEEKNYILKCNLSSDSEISESGAEAFLNELLVMVEWAKCEKMSLNDVQKQVILSPVSSDAVKVGEKAESVAQQVTGILFPLIVCIVLFVMIIMYGSSISKTVIAEKTSKLLETLLVSVKPYAIIAGKILAMTSVAILQFFIWISSIISGYAVGNIINESIDSSYKSEIYKLLEVIKSGKDAFTIQGIILAILALCIGFFMYCVIAGAVCSGVKKAEELSGAMTLFQIPVFIGYFAVCMAPAINNETILNITKYVPFSAAFRLPADILIGNITAGGAIISILLMLLTSLAAIYIAGRIYKKKLF